MVDFIPTDPGSEAESLLPGPLLARWGIDFASCRIERPHFASGFSGAAIFRVKTGNSMYCLRRWPPAGLTPHRIRALHHFLRHLAAAGVREIPTPVTAAGDHSLIGFRGEQWQLEPWMPGRADFHRSPSESRLRSAMQLLARLHLIAETYDCPPQGRAWFDRRLQAPAPAVLERLSRLAEWTGNRRTLSLSSLTAPACSQFDRLACDILQMLEMAAGPVAAELRSLCDTRFRLHPCLRDIWHDHVLFTGDEVTGLIDPAAARMENVASDLSRLLGSLLSDDPPGWNAALSAYEELRPLSLDEHRLIRALDRSGVLLSGLTWIDRRLTGTITDADLPRVTTRLASIHRRLLRLMGSMAL